jgi:YbgC/YbaW family acyl-CoA thioester hydrolase
MPSFDLSPFTFNTTKSILFEPGAMAKIGALALKALGDRVMVVTDQGIRAAGLLDPALASLVETGLEPVVFDAVEADPSRATVEACVEAIKAHGANGVIGLGGGSSMDVAKLAALLAAGHDALDDIWGVGFAKGPRLPLMLVPTTAGTGSEVTPISIVTVGETEKRGVVSPVILPDIALLDPDLTLGLPAHTTAATGIDAMVHAIEAYASKSASNNPLSKMLARQALQLMGAHLEKAVHHPGHKEARSAMLFGSMLAGMAFANSPVAAVHALAYPIGGTFHVPHGLSNALVLPHVLRFNAPEAAHLYAEIACDLFPKLDPDQGAQGLCSGFIEGLAELSEKIGLQTRLRELGHPRKRDPANGFGRHAADTASGEQPTRGDRGRCPVDLQGGVVTMADQPSNRLDFPAFVSIPTRWEDVDIYGHVNNVKYYSYFDTAVNAWLLERDLVRPGQSPVFGIVVETQCTFLRELKFPQMLDVGIAITKLGTSSVTYAIGIFAQGEADAAARGRFVHVYVDETNRRPAPIPDDIRQAFQPLLV